LAIVLALGMAAEATDGFFGWSIPVRCPAMDSADLDSINLALLALRCGVGAVMLAHGINHIFGGGKIAGTARWFASLGMKPGIVHAWLASVTEVVGGALLVVGLLTPFGGAAVIGVMLVALITNHRGNGFFIFRPGEGWEYVMTLTIAGFAIAVLGAGEWSVDHAADLWQPWPGKDGLLIALIAGVGGAAALLAGFWRPEKKPAD
jgi:putative oxidoreductase